MYGAESPDALEYFAVDGDDEELELKDLGLDPMVDDSVDEDDVAGDGDLTAQVLAFLREFSGVADLAVEDGLIPLRRDDISASLKVGDSALGMFSVIEVPEGSPLPPMVLANGLNTNLHNARFFTSDELLIGVIEVPIVPLVPAIVGMAIDRYFDALEAATELVAAASTELDLSVH